MRRLTSSEFYPVINSWIKTIHSDLMKVNCKTACSSLSLYFLISTFGVHSIILSNSKSSWEAPKYFLLTTKDNWMSFWESQVLFFLTFKHMNSWISLEHHNSPVCYLSCAHIKHRITFTKLKEKTQLGFTPSYLAEVISFHMTCIFGYYFTYRTWSLGYRGQIYNIESVWQVYSPIHETSSNRTINLQAFSKR